LAGPPVLAPLLGLPVQSKIPEGGTRDRQLPTKDEGGPGSTPGQAGEAVGPLQGSLLAPSRLARNPSRVSTRFDWKPESCGSSLLLIA